MKTANGSQLHLGKNIIFMIKLLENKIPIVQFILDTFFVFLFCEQ